MYIPAQIQLNMVRIVEIAPESDAHGVEDAVISRPHLVGMSVALVAGAPIERDARHGARGEAGPTVLLSQHT